MLNKRFIGKKNNNNKEFVRVHKNFYFKFKYTLLSINLKYALSSLLYSPYID